jgi:hypothetical protein
MAIFAHDLVVEHFAKYARFPVAAQCSVLGKSSAAASAGAAGANPDQVRVLAIICPGLMALGAPMYTLPND